MSAAKGFVIPAGGGKQIDSSTPGRFFALKLLGRETGESIMMFEENLLPAGTGASIHHLHHDSDEVAWVLSSEFYVQDRQRDHGRRSRNLCLYAA